MVSNGKGEVGASKITGEILDIVAKLPKAVESLTGIDISKVCSLYYVPISLVSKLLLVIQCDVTFGVAWHKPSVSEQ